MRQLCKGNVAVMKGAVLAGCRAYYGYPITPASEVAEAAALYLPEVGGTFVQAESETASINMVYGAASAGVRVMTASSGPGLSLMQEGISYLAGAELPCVIVDVMRGGPGLGQHRARTERLLRHGQGRRTRQLPQPRGRSGLGAGDGRSDHPGLRTRRQISQSRHRADRRFRRTNDGAARSRSIAKSSRRQNPGQCREPPEPARTWSARSTSSPMIWKSTSAVWRRNIFVRSRAEVRWEEYRTDGRRTDRGRLRDRVAGAAFGGG